ncbi:MAG TPA: hypothetical protein GX405_11520 [Rhizobiales bacterium]|nr:hypothetical protein [Hyphomicrobiales bacterium]
MNATPSMVRHDSKAAPGPHGRSQARIERGQDAFDRLLHDAAPVAVPAAETGGTETPAIAGEAFAAGDAEGNETRTRTAHDVTAGFLPFLRIVLPEGREAGGTPSDDIRAAFGGPAASGAQPEVPYRPASQATAATDSASGSTPAMVRTPTASQANAAADGASSPSPAEPRRPADPRKTADTRHALAARPGTDTRLASEALPAIDRSQSDTLRHTPATVVSAATPPPVEAASAASASMSLLSRLNLMSAPAGRSAPTRVGTTAGETPAGTVRGTADAAAGDTAEVAPTPVARATAADEAGDRSPRPGERPDGAGPTAERAAPLPTSLPQAGQPPSIATQIVQVLASSSDGAAPFQKVVTTAHVDTPPGGTIRSLTIQLRPHELGQVTAKLSMAGGQLSIEIEVDTIEAHHKLSNESDTIIKALRTHGIAVDQVTIQAPQSNAAARGGVGAETPAFAGQDTGGSSHSGNPAGGSRNDSSPDRDHGQETRSIGESHASGTRSAGGVYI